MRFEVYYRKVTDGRAPEHVDLSQEYTKGSTLEAINRRAVEQKLFKQFADGSLLAGGTRALAIGDVLIEYGSTKQSLIYTLTGAWAQVKLVKE